MFLSFEPFIKFFTVVTPKRDDYGCGLSCGEDGDSEDEYYGYYGKNNHLKPKPNSTPPEPNYSNPNPNQTPSELDCGGDLNNRTRRDWEMGYKREIEDQGYETEGEDLHENERSE